MCVTNNHCISVKSEVVEAGCRLPQNFSGEFMYYLKQYVRLYTTKSSISNLTKLNQTSNKYSLAGDWINTANIDADVFINETHIIETYYPDEGRYRRTIYVCKEQKDTRVMMARLTVDGW